MNLMAWKWKCEPGQGYSDLYKRIVPLFVRRQGGGWGTWLAAYLGWGAWKGRGYLWYYRAHNRYLMARVRTAGGCGHNPRYAALMSRNNGGGGYSHWRCGLPKHGTRSDMIGQPHRYRNYTWDHNGKTEYSPIEGHRSEYAKWLDKVHPVLTMREKRLFRRNIEASRKARVS